jgi:hypothetical protein
MAQTRGGQNDENADPLTELGVEGRGAPAKKKRGGTNEKRREQGRKQKVTLQEMKM